MSVHADFPTLEQAFAQAMRKRVLASVGHATIDMPADEYAALVAELVTWDALEGRVELSGQQRESARVAFALLRDATSASAEGRTELTWQLRLGCLAVLADMPQEAARNLSAGAVAGIPEPTDWLAFTRASVWTAWLGLVRLNSRADAESSKTLLAKVKSEQKKNERAFLERLGTSGRSAALELVGLYFLGSAAERLSEYLLTGLADGAGDIEAQLEMYFDRVMHAWGQGAAPADADLALLLQPTAHAIAAGSIRAATKSANSLTRRFADSLISRSTQPLFRLLPPQREALRKQGLATNVHRSVVVNFPTSSGKTLLAQFNILQSLNDLGNERGWVAYVAPTRALVNQVTNRLRRDFSALDKRVERLSPALEFDSIELSALGASELQRDGPPVDVFVCTPEKLDLLIRREELCQQLGRLALVVVDEAHNLAAQGERSIKLELLLATINREHPSARFMLLTPFISNAKQVAEWLDRDSAKDYSIEAEWIPNDRVIGIVSPPARQSDDRGRKADHLSFRPVQTTKGTLHLDEELKLEGVQAALGLTVASLHQNAGKLSAAAVQVLSKRGPTVLLCRTVRDTWTTAERLSKGAWSELPGAADRDAVARFASYELGDNVPLVALLSKGLAVHHAGLPEELAQAIEWLFEERKLHALSATTTLAQGVNFPIANLVVSSIYPATRDGAPMSYSDFWNIAGRVGRVDQDAVGVVALAATSPERRDTCEVFLERSMKELVSTLVGMVSELARLSAEQGLSSLVYRKEWSAFSQFIAHTLRQVGIARFTDQVELVLRGSFGYQTLRDQNLPLARELLTKTRQYAQHIATDMGSVALVDATGFSFESVRNALAQLGGLGELDDLLNPAALFSGKSVALRDVMGVLLSIPEVRDDLVAGGGGDGSRIADMLVDWVKGTPLQKLAAKYFPSETDDEDAVTQCVRSFRRLSMTSAWGLSSVLAMKFGKEIDQLPPAAKEAAVNIPSMVLYGVWNSQQIALRAAGVPRNAALSLSEKVQERSPFTIRRVLLEGGESLWAGALGPQRGRDYFRVWKMLEKL